LIDNGQIVAVNFLPGAGGKFIQNCLALSKHCVLKRADWTDWQLAQTEYNTEFYQQKLNWAVSTVPTDMLLWQQRELGDEQYFGRLFLSGTTQNLTSDQLPDCVHRTAQQHLWSTYSAHNHAVIDYLRAYWPTVKIVNVWPARKFLEQWLPQKNQAMWLDYANLTDEDYANYRGHSPADESFQYDMDNTFYHEQAFAEQMAALYEYLGYTDWAQAPVMAYYRHYRAQHELQ
jgi:hypothetical protein